MLKILNDSISDFIIFPRRSVGLSVVEMKTCEVFLSSELLGLPLTVDDFVFVRTLDIFVSVSQIMLSWRTSGIIFLLLGLFVVTSGNIFKSEMFSGVLMRYSMFDILVYDS